MPSPEELIEALRVVVDPELGVNVVDLGLVYGARVEDGLATVELTMTSPACPMGDLIIADARDELLRRFPDLRHVEVELTFSPPWSPERMSNAAREQLGWHP